MADAAQLKIDAARKALSYVENGMKLGIGTGSTAEAFVELLAERVDDGLEIVGVPTSERTAALCTKLQVPLSSLNELKHLDLTIDGADEVDYDLNLIKGGGGALLREKIVADASDAMIVIADNSKVVKTLGAFKLPIEVNKFGWMATERKVEQLASKLGLSGALGLRYAHGDLFETDGGHYIMDASFEHIPDASALAEQLNAIPGVVEHGLFIGLAKTAVIAAPEGVQIMEKS